MATAYTSLLGFALPVTGELSGTWGDTVNDSITQLVEDSVAGSATASVTSGDWTLTTTGSGQANQARCAILIPTGSPGVTRNIIAPSSSKSYIVDNQSNGAVVVKGAATTGATVAAGAKAVVAWNGTDFVVVATTAADGVTTISFGSTGLTPSTGTAGAVTVGGTLAVGSGGTGQTSLTANNVILGNGASAVQFVAPGSNGNVLTSNGTTWTSAAAPSFSQVYPGAGIAVSTGTAWGTSKTSPTGDIVGTSDSQTLTNKTLTDPAIIGTILEDVYTISDGAAFEIDPGNGSIQLITLGASRTPKATNFAAGEAITLMVDDGSGYTITWTDATFGSGGVIWETDAGVAPTLSTTGYTTIVLWKVGTQVYGARVGDA